MNNETKTRESLHVVAEWLLAGPQLDASDTVRLQVVHGGFATIAEPAVSVRNGLITRGDVSVGIDGMTVRELGAALGLVPTSPASAYTPAWADALDHALSVDDAACGRITRWYEWGATALEAFTSDVTPVLWPEHFDLAIAWDEVNYGVSPGDGHHAGPYAYVGPWTPRVGEFWNAPFGALRPSSEISSSEELAAFFRQGHELARG